MAILEFFTLTGSLAAIVVDYVDAGTDPDVQNITCTVTLTPRIPRGELLWAPGLTPPRGIALPRMVARFDPDGILRTIVGAAVNAQQTITVTGTSPYALTFDGHTTTSLAYNVPLATVDAAIEALPNVGAGDITVGGTPGSSYVVSFVGTLGSAPQPVMTTNNVGVTVATTRAGTLGAGVKLTANTAVIDRDELLYDVEFTNVTYNKSADNIISSFAFAAPTTGGVTVDLSTVTKLLPKAG